MYKNPQFKGKKMKLTSKGRYAVMALVDLARFDNINPVSLRDISLRQGISLDYLEQIFSKLKKNEIVKSIRGTQGGYVLNKNPNDIKLTNIFHAVDEKVKTVQCKKESKKGCNGKATKCITHNLWDELETHINTFFEKKSLKDLLNNNKETRDEVPGKQETITWQAMEASGHRKDRERPRKTVWKTAKDRWGIGG